MDPSKGHEHQVFLKIEDILLPIAEAESILRALRGGEVDAVVVEQSGSSRIYTLAGADHPYRVLVDTMNEGAVMLSEDGSITYCNKRFADMLNATPEELMGNPIARFVRDGSKLESLISSGDATSRKGEIVISNNAGVTVETLFSVGPLQLDDTRGFCIVVTDLTDQKRHQALELSTKLERSRREHAEAARRLVSNILESITDSYIAVDHQGTIAEVNERAAVIFGTQRPNLIGKNLWETYPQTVGSEFYRRVHQAISSQTPEHFEAGSIWSPGKWFEVHLYPSPDRLFVYLRDITERKLVEQERERLFVEQNETNRRKDEFLAMLSHELRNPLAPILNALEVLRRSGHETELTSTISVINRQVQDLARLIDDLLDASRITSGKVRLHIETIDLPTVLARAIETARPLIEARQHRLTVRPLPMSLWVNADPTRLAQVFSNLLNNAAKYTPEGGEIGVTVERSETDVKVSISDSGIGIPSEVLPRIFDLFTQADRSLDRSQGGLGIGLTLARSLVQMHGGSIQVSSAGPGNGSMFMVSLPTAAAPVDRNVELPITAAPASVTPRRVLVVDDNPDSTETLALLLRLSGHEVAMASDGESALEVARMFRPQIILLDVGLPGMHGYQVAERLRSLPENQTTVIIALTGYGQEQDRKRALQAGFDHHFVKPVDFKKLETLLNSLSAVEGAI